MGRNFNRQTWLSDLLCMLPAFIFIVSITLVRLHLFSMPLSDVYWSEATDSTVLADLFSYWKAIAIIGAACLSLLIFVCLYFKDMLRIKTRFICIPALVYVVFILLSYALSNYKYFALRGMNEHFEGTIVLLSYIVMMLFLANVIDSKRRLKTVVYFTFAVACILGILGVTQATGHDFFSTAFGQKLMTPNYTLDTGINSWDMIDILSASGQKMYNFSFTDGEVYQTVYNINYVPLYLALLLPVAAFTFLFISKQQEDKKIIGPIALLAIYGLLLFNYFVANSASGYVGLLMAFFAAVFVFYKYFKKMFKPLLCLFLITGLVMGVTANRWLPEVKKGISDVTLQTTSIVYADDLNVQTEWENAPESKGPFLDYVESCGDHLDFSMNGNVLRIVRDSVNGGYLLNDSEGNPLYISPIDNDPGWYQVLDERFHDFIRVGMKNIDDKSYYVIHVWGNEWPFRHNGKDFVLRNVLGKETTMRKIPHATILDYRFGSQRGLIWDTTIPLLKHYIIKGSGADTFVFSYPQNDYVTLSNYFGHSMRNLVTDKAHNLYLQYWINTGFISLLAWLTMVGYYLVGAVKQFRKRGFSDFCDFVNGGIFCGICGFLAVAFFNDGSVNTMPMFYTMLGTGLAINMRDKWPSDEPTGETNGTDGMDPGEGKKKGKKAKAAAEAMPEM